MIIFIGVAVKKDRCMSSKANCLFNDKFRFFWKNLRFCFQIDMPFIWEHGGGVDVVGVSLIAIKSET